MRFSSTPQQDFKMIQSADNDGKPAAHEVPVLLQIIGRMVVKNKNLGGVVCKECLINWIEDAEYASLDAQLVALSSCTDIT